MVERLLNVHLKLDLISLEILGALIGLLILPSLRKMVIGRLLRFIIEVVRPISLAHLLLSLNMSMEILVMINPINS